MHCITPHLQKPPSQILIESHRNSAGQEMHHHRHKNFSYLEIWQESGGQSKFLLSKLMSCPEQGPAKENRCSVFSVSTLHTHRSVMTRDSLKHVKQKVAHFKSPLLANPSISVCIHSLHRSIVTQDLGTEVSVSASSVEASTVVGDIPVTTVSTVVGGRLYLIL